MKLIKRIASVFLITAVALPLAPVSSANAAEISGFDQLSECVRSEGTTNLNLFFLVDSSASLRTQDGGRGPGTDPNDLRADVLSQSIQQIAGLNNDSVKVSFALTTFDKTSPGKGKGKYDWTEATSENAAKAAEYVEKVIPDQDFGPRTDWRAGLKEAKSQLAKGPNNGGTVCNAIIWFTDGELDVNGDKKQNSAAIEEMCGVAPLDSKSRGDIGIVPSLRRDGVILIGVLLRAGERETTKGLVSFFAPIVLGSGDVDSSVFGGSPSQGFECGPTPIPQNYGHGSLIVATNPDDLAREFLRMIFIIKNGDPLPENANDEFTVDPGVSEVSVLIPSDKWQIDAPKGVGLIANNSKDSRFKIDVFGKTSTVVFKVNKEFLGKWKVRIQAPNSEHITVFMQSGLRISVDKRHSTLTAGAGPQDVTGFIKSGNDLADLSVYNQARTTLTITQVDLTNQNRSLLQKAMTIDAKGSWHGLFTPLEGAPRGSMKMTLKVVTKSGVELPPISQNYSFDLFVPEAFCQIKSTKINLSPLTYKPHAAAKGKLQVSGGSTGNCGIAFQNPVVQGDPLGRLASDFNFIITDEENGQVVKPGQWRQIEAGDLKTYVISVDNPLKSNGETVINLPIQRRTAESQQYVESSLEISFVDKTISKPIWPIALLLMVIGLAIPFGILHLVNFFFARFRLGAASIAVVRVKVQIAPDDRVTLSRVDEVKTVLAERDFDSMPVNMGNAKAFDAESRGGDVTAKLRAQLPLNPFAAVSGIALANSSDVISGSESPRFTVDGSRAGAALNPNGYFFVTAARDTQVQDGVAGQSYEAVLTAFLTDLIPGDPEHRVPNLLDTIAGSEIWSEFAQLLLAKPIVGASKPAKGEKVKREKKRKPAKEEKSRPEENDPWDSDASTSTVKPTVIKDNSSRPQPKENASPSKPPAVDEDDPWA